MHISVWLFVGVALMLPWFRAILRLMDPQADKADPLNPGSTPFWFFILGIIVLAFGIGVSLSGRHP